MNTLYKMEKLGKGNNQEEFAVAGSWADWADLVEDLGIFENEFSNHFVEMEEVSAPAGSIEGPVVSRKAFLTIHGRVYSPFISGILDEEGNLWVTQEEMERNLS